MENKRKELRYLSLGLFALIIIRILSAATYLIDLSRIDVTLLEANVAAALPYLKALGIVSAGFTVIVLGILGVKGLMEAKRPSGARYHIRLAIVSGIFFALNLVLQISDLFGSSDLLNTIGNVLLSGLVLIDVISYARTAKAVRIKG